MGPTQRLRIRPELPSRNFKFREILEINEPLKQEFVRTQKAMTRRHRWHRVHLKSPQMIFIFLVSNHELEGEVLGLAEFCFYFNALPSLFFRR
jgi:hypothetical protein